MPSKILGRRTVGLAIILVALATGFGLALLLENRDTPPTTIWAILVGGTSIVALIRLPGAWHDPGKSVLYPVIACLLAAVAIVVLLTDARVWPTEATSWVGFLAIMAIAGLASNTSR